MDFYSKVSTDIPACEGMTIEAEMHRGHCLTSDSMFGMTGYHKLSKVYNWECQSTALSYSECPSSSDLEILVRSSAVVPLATALNGF